jgi:hypothetical protein
MEKKFLKTIAVFLAITISADVLFPTISLAIGSGPTAPEYNSFMQAGEGLSVSPQTGDLNYNLTLLKLPCPEGDYPINLFYSAGIKPEQDASWVGLGWNMNVGSISRTVKGIPDDYYNSDYNVVDKMTAPTYQPYSDDVSPASFDLITGKDYSSPLFVDFPNVQTNTTTTSVTGSGSYTNTFQTIFNQYGILHGKTASQGNINSIMFDSYPLYDNDATITYNKMNPEAFNGPSLPAYDEYVVSGQGISGVMEPLVLENASLFRQLKDGFYSGAVESGNASKSYQILKPFNNTKQQFRFKNEFSNSMLATPNDFYAVGTHSAAIDFGPDGLGYSYSVPDANSFDPSTQRFPGSNHVEYYLNEEIVAGTAKANGFLNYQGYMNTQRTNFVYNDPNSSVVLPIPAPVSKQIGGFSVTDPNGVTYHYALPVYTYEDTKTSSYSYVIPNSGTATFYRKTVSAAPYAYTWLLTSVTGADFYDANNNGVADQGDWGRWTNFVYNRSTDKYSFRNPLTGVTYDENGVEAVTGGYKELYYLEAAYSRTHSVIFVKDLRTDATAADQGGFVTLDNPLKLNSVVLFKNEAISTINTALGGTNQDFFSCFGNINKAFNSNTSSPIWSSTGIIDTKDIQTIVALPSANYKSNIISQVDLNYDYSLCPFIKDNPLADLTNVGKLTLKSVKISGQNDYAPFAPTSFNYELDTPVSANAYISHLPGQLAQGDCYGRIDIGAQGSNLKEGDIIKMVFDDGKTFFATLIKGYNYYDPAITSLYDVIFLGDNIPGTGKIWTSTPAIVTTTKNPPYTKDFTDTWDYFKSDYKGFNSVKAKNKQTSPNSSLSIDAWSLRTIESSTGAQEKIEYESDSYSSSSFNKDRVLNIEPKFQYTPAYSSGWSSLVSYGDMNQINYYGNFKFYITEKIGKELFVGMRVGITTIATFTPNTDDEEANWNATTTCVGSDFFEISNVNLQDNSITGNFASAIVGTQSNPFWMSPPNNATFIYHNASFLTFNRNTIAGYTSLGGGLRVLKTTKRENGNSNTELTTTYGYNDPIGKKSSGYVSTDPVSIVGLTNSNSETPTDDRIYPIDKTSGSVPFRSYVSAFRNINKTAHNAGLLIPTGVSYEYNSVQKSVNGNAYPTYTQAQFRKLTEDMLSYTKSTTVTTSNSSKYSTISIIDNTSQAGTVLNVKSINLADGETLSETKYNYNSSINDLTNFQGVVEQVFNEKRIDETQTYTYNMSTNSLIATPTDKPDIGVITKLSCYPTVLMSIQSNDYLKKISTSLSNKAFDLYNGKVSKQETKDSYGNQFITESLFAYNTYPEMGLKYLGTSYKNMLNAPSGSMKYKYNTNILNPVAKYIGASNIIWSKTNTVVRGQASANIILSDQFVNHNIWRPDNSYMFNTNLAADGTTLTEPYFDFANPANNTTNWIKSNQPKKYDAYSKLTMSSNANDISECVRYGYNGTKPIATCGLGNNYEFTFSGAEDPNTEISHPNVAMSYTNVLGYFGGDVSGVSLRDATHAHTGKYSLKLASSGGTGFNYKAYIKPEQMIIGRTYKASVWVYNNAAANDIGLNYVVNGINANGSTFPTTTSGAAYLSPTSTTCGNWKLVDLVFTVPNFVGNYYIEFYCQNSNSATEAWVDDFRVQPVESSMNCYVYDELTDKVTYILNKDNFYVRFEYDKIGRLIANYRETVNGEKKTNDTYYNYAKKP